MQAPCATGAACEDVGIPRLVSRAALANTHLRTRVRSPAWLRNGLPVELDRKSLAGLPNSAFGPLVHAGTGAGSASGLANGLKVNAIANAPRPNAQEPM